MQLTHSSLVLFALLPAFGLAAPAAPAAKASTSKAAAGAAATGAPATGGGASNGTAPPAGGAVSQAQIANAVLGWMNDTGKVTKFLNTATSISSTDEYTLQAQIALNAEIDELNHKKVLDAALGSMPQVQAANDTLATQGTFQAVVDALQAMVNEGPDTAQAKVTEINNNRCVNVLPNINMYFAAAGSSTIQAVVPTGCLEVAGAPGATPGGPPAGVAPPGGNNNNNNNNNNNKQPPPANNTSAAASSTTAAASSSTAAAASSSRAAGSNVGAGAGAAARTSAGSSRSAAAKATAKPTGSALPKVAAKGN